MPPSALYMTASVAISDTEDMNVRSVGHLLYINNNQARLTPLLHQNRTRAPSASLHIASSFSVTTFCSLDCVACICVVMSLRLSHRDINVKTADLMQT